MQNISKALLLWGTICLVGFGIFEFAQTDLPTFLASWGMLLVIGIAGLFAWVPGVQRKSFVLSWTVIVVIGLGISAAWLSGALPPGGIPFPFFSLWLVLLAAGFFLTGFRTHEKAWAGIGILNLLVLAGVLFSFPPVVEHVAGLMALVNGVPSILMAFKY